MIEENYRGTAHQIFHITGFLGKSLITIFNNSVRTLQTYDPSLISFSFFVKTSYLGDFQTLNL